MWAAALFTLLRAPRDGREEMSSHRVEVPLRTSHIRHLKASALFLKVHTLQSQYPSSDDGFGCRFGLKKREV